MNSLNFRFFVQAAGWLESMIKKERYQSVTKLSSEGELAQIFKLN